LKQFGQCEGILNDRLLTTDPFLSR
jgi:hypothetical protein